MKEKNSGGHSDYEQSCFIVDSGTEFVFLLAIFRGFNLVQVKVNLRRLFNQIGCANYLDNQKNRNEVIAFEEKSKDVLTQITKSIIVAKLIIVIF